MKKTTATEKGIFGFIDALSEIGLEAEVDSEFGKPEEDMKLKSSKASSKAAEKS